MEDNDIYESDWHGVVINAQAEPLLQNNRIFNNRKSGVFMQDGAMPTLPPLRLLPSPALPPASGSG